MSDRDPDPASRPWVFNPHGFLLAVVEGPNAEEPAKAALRRLGFSDGDFRTFTGQEVLDDRERFLAQQPALRRLVGQVTSDSDAVQRFLEYARDGRSFVWVHVPDRERADRAVRGLSSDAVLHLRYYGDDTIEDIHMG